MCTLYIIRLAGPNIRQDLKASFILNSFFQMPASYFLYGFWAQSGHTVWTFQTGKWTQRRFRIHVAPAAFHSTGRLWRFSFFIRITAARLTKIFAATWERFVARESLETSVMRKEGRKDAPSNAVWCTWSFFTLMMSTSSSSWLWQESYNNLLSA